MASSHHGEESQFLKAFMDQIPPVARDLKEESLLRRYMEQAEGRAKRAYPEGRIGADDDGELAMVVRADIPKQTVIIDFGKPVVWLGLKPDDVRGLIELLQKHLELVESPAEVPASV